MRVGKCKLQCASRFPRKVPHPRINKNRPSLSQRRTAKLKITIKRVQNRARMALPSVSDFGKANITIVMETTVSLYVRTRTLYII